VTFDRSDESAKALESGRCDTLASDQSQLYALRIKLSNPAEWIVLPEVISKEPLGLSFVVAMKTGSPLFAGRCLPC
jgi:general L-amino acid transport system substrate-binding protein